MRRLLPLFICLSVSLVVSAQTETDALRFVRTSPTGTARSTAMGGAFGSLGGDFGAALQNPAGLGVYRSSELSLTPEIFYNAIDAQYANNSTRDWVIDAGFAQFGYVAAFKSRGRNLVGGSFGIGFNTVNNFLSYAEIEGYNISTSRVDPLIESANTGAFGYPVAPYYLNSYKEKLFFDGYILDWDEYGTYFLNSEMCDPEGNVNLDQFNSIERFGKMSEWTFAMALNFRHRLYLGASFSITPIDYTKSSLFTESEAGTTLDYYTFDEIEIVEGTGYSGKFGLIFKPVGSLRMGLSYQTPSVYNLTRIAYATLDSYIEGITIYPVDPDGYEKGDSISSYALRTPGKWVGSLGFMLGKFMILSSDLELIDYSAIRYEARNIRTDFAEQNHALANDLGWAMNLRGGAELRMKNVYLRGGLAYLGSPYKPGISQALSYQMSYSGGIGYRLARLSVDFALSYQDYRATEVLYDSPYQAGVSASALNSRTVQAITTIGMRF